MTSKRLIVARSIAFPLALSLSDQQNHGKMVYGVEKSSDNVEEAERS